MNVYDACERAYKNGWNAGRTSMVNQCVVCGAEMAEGGHVCTTCMNETFHSNRFSAQIDFLRPNTELSFGAGNGVYDFSINYRRAKPLNRFQIWMYKVCFGIRARNI